MMSSKELVNLVNERASEYFKTTPPTYDGVLDVMTSSSVSKENLHPNPPNGQSGLRNNILNMFVTEEGSYPSVINLPLSQISSSLELQSNSLSLGRLLSSSNNNVIQFEYPSDYYDTGSSITRVPRVAMNRNGSVDCYRDVIGLGHMKNLRESIVKCIGVYYAMFQKLFYNRIRFKKEYNGITIPSDNYIIGANPGANNSMYVHYYEPTSNNYSDTFSAVLDEIFYARLIKNRGESIRYLANLSAINSDPSVRYEQLDYFRMSTPFYTYLQPDNDQRLYLSNTPSNKVTSSEITTNTYWIFLSFSYKNTSNTSGQIVLFKSSSIADKFLIWIDLHTNTLNVNKPSWISSYVLYDGYQTYPEEYRMYAVKISINGGATNTHLIDPCIAYTANLDVNNPDLYGFPEGVSIDLGPIEIFMDTDYSDDSRNRGIEFYRLYVPCVKYINYGKNVDGSTPKYYFLLERDVEIDEVDGEGLPNYRSSINPKGVIHLSTSHPVVEDFTATESYWSKCKYSRFENLNYFDPSSLTDIELFSNHNALYNVDYIVENNTSASFPDTLRYITETSGVLKDYKVYVNGELKCLGDEVIFRFRYYNDLEGYPGTSTPRLDGGTTEWNFRRENNTWQLYYHDTKIIGATWLPQNVNSQSHLGLPGPVKTLPDDTVFPDKPEDAMERFSCLYWNLRLGFNAQYTPIQKITVCINSSYVELNADYHTDVKFIDSIQYSQDTHPPVEDYPVDLYMSIPISSLQPNDYNSDGNIKKLTYRIYCLHQKEPDEVVFENVNPKSGEVLVKLDIFAHN